MGNSNEDDKSGGNTGSGTLIPREPDAVKAARPVRRRGCGNVPIIPGEHRTALGESAPSLDRQRAMPLSYDNRYPRRSLSDIIITQFGKTSYRVVRLAAEVLQVRLSESPNTVERRCVRG